MRSILTISLLLLLHKAISAQPLAPLVSPQSQFIFDVITRGDSEVLALASGGNLIRSTDNGESWFVLDAPDTTSTRLYLDSAGSLFIGSEQMLYVESTEGSGWVPAYDRAVDRFVAAPDRSYWIVDAKSGIPLRLVPSGSGEWEGVPGMPGPARDLVITPDSTVWIAIDASIYRSSNGAPFERHGSELTQEKRNNQPDTIARMLALRSGEVVVVTRSGAWASRRDSSSWERRVSTYHFAFDIHDLREDRGGTIYVTQPVQLFSDDGMRSLQSFLDIGSSRGINVIAENDTYQFGGGHMFNRGYDTSGRWSSLIVRRPGGTSAAIRQTWITSYATGLPQGQISVIPFDSTTLFVHYSNYRSTTLDYSLPLELRRDENGRDRYWTTIRGGEVDRNFLPSVDGISVSVTRYHLAFSRDHGRTWDSIAVPTGRLMADEITDLGDGRYVVWAMDVATSTYIYSIASIEDGSWEDRGWLPNDRNGLPKRTWMMPDGTLVGVIPTGLLVSRDTAKTWQRAINGLNALSEIYATVVGADGVNVALAFDGRSYVDMGGAQAWTQSPEILAPGEFGGAADALDGVIYVGRGNGSIYKSMDNGISWTELASLPRSDDAAIALTASDHGTLYIGTRIGYLYALDIPKKMSDVPVLRKLGRIDLR